MTALNKSFGYVAALPHNFRTSFLYICQELASLSDKWNLYLGLFSKKENVDLLNVTAPRAFKSIEEALRVDIAMSICRLADPMKSCGHENLSIDMLINKLPNHIEGLKERISDFKSLSYSVITTRIKRFAHNDMNSILYPKDNPFPGVSRSTIDSIIKSLSSILNLISSHYKGTDLDFNVLPINDAQDLYYWLSIGYEKIQIDKKAMIDSVAK